MIEVFFVSTPFASNVSLRAAWYMTTLQPILTTRVVKILRDTVNLLKGFLVDVHIGLINEGRFGELIWQYDDRTSFDKTRF